VPGTGIHVRPPRPGDEPAAAALLNAHDADEWRHAQSVWLVERAGELAGCGTLGRAGRGRLRAVACTHPDHAGQGVGALLVELAERRAGATILRNSVLA
jgi:N-acetylglutamate synthase-like GNAT family acetyltransferase